MRVFRSLDSIASGDRGSAVAIGKFDGVHSGHQAILRDLTRVARDRALQTVVFTFETHPLQVIAPERCPLPLTSPEQRLTQLERAGVDLVVMIPFDRQFSEMSPDDFVADILVERLGVKYVSVGEDFRFGQGRQGTVDLLETLGRKYDFEVHRITDVVGDRGVRVSSTLIREALDAGDVTLAAHLLGRPPCVAGTVVQGDARGRELGYPTANIGGDVQGFIPGDGVYAGWLTAGEQRYPAAISIGTNPTFEGVEERRVEAYVIDASLELYGETVTVDFVEHLRGMERFDTVDALIAQMDADVARARQVLEL